MTMEKMQSARAYILDCITQDDIEKINRKFEGVMI